MQVYFKQRKTKELSSFTVNSKQGESQGAAIDRMKLEKWGREKDSWVTITKKDYLE